MRVALKPLLAGILVGVMGTLLVAHVLDKVGRDVPKQLTDALQCPGPIPSTPAAARHAEDGPNGYSWFAATHADRIVYTGCDLGPGALYLHFDPGIEISHVLTTLDHFGAVCVAEHGVFDGKILDGRTQLEDLCDEVGGRLVNLEDRRRSAPALVGSR
jgi:hypothetical protein